MKQTTKKLLTVLTLLLCVCLCLPLASCGDDAGENEETVGGTAADSAAGTEAPAPKPSAPEQDNSKGDEGDDEEEDNKKPSAPKPTEVLLNSSTENVRMLNARDTVSLFEMTCDYIGSGIAFRMNHTGGDVALNVALSTGSCTFLVKVDGEPFEMNGSPYLVATQSGKITATGIPTGEHTVEFVKVSGYTESYTTLYKLAFFGTLVKETDLPAENFRIEILDETSLSIGITDGAGKAGSAADQSYAAFLNGYEAEVSMLDFGDAGLLRNSNTVLDRYRLRSPDRAEEEYGFEETADLVIVNIGALDYAASDTPAEQADAFAQKYRALLNLIREKNGITCRILCLYASEGCYGAEIQAACAAMGGTNEGIYTLEIPAECWEDGVLSAVELEPQQEAIKALIDGIMEEIEAGYELTVEQSGSGMELDYSDFYKK